MVRQDEEIARASGRDIAQANAFALGLCDIPFLDNAIIVGLYDKQRNREALGLRFAALAILEISYLWNCWREKVRIARGSSR